MGEPVNSLRVKYLTAANAYDQSRREGLADHRKNDAPAGGPWAGAHGIQDAAPPGLSSQHDHNTTIRANLDAVLLRVSESYSLPNTTRL